MDLEGEFYRSAGPKTVSKRTSTVLRKDDGGGTSLNLTAALAPESRKSNNLNELHTTSRASSGDYEELLDSEVRALIANNSSNDLQTSRSGLGGQQQQKSKYAMLCSQTIEFPSMLKEVHPMLEDSRLDRH